MKQYQNNHCRNGRTLMACALASFILLLCGCSEDLYSPSAHDGETTTITLNYSDTSPRDITVNTRATEAEERRLDDLYIYIFNEDGYLTGYKQVTEGLDQNTSSSNQAAVSGIKTRVGQAYIYAVANISTGLYPVATSSGTVQDGKLPINLDETKAQNCEYDFTKDMLLSLPFTRNNDETIQISSAFLMSGAVSNGQAVTVTSSGSITGGNVIKLNRIVSKVKFTIKAATGNSRTFKLSTYDIMRVSKDGKLVGTADNNARYEAKSVSDITGMARGVNDVDTEGREFFEVYLPENLQTRKNDVSTWHKREDDGETATKAFANAPANGTYVVLRGKYSEVKSGVTKNADVTYYVHLGDCSADVNNYDVERNCRYTYNITVEGVDQIIVEAKKTGNNEQPGAEGVVLEYGSAGKNMILDSHYEYMVMRFYQKDIKTLKENGHGYYYQVQTINGKTDPIEVTTEVTGNLNGTDTDWIEFAIGTSKYSSNATNRGTACDYPGKGNTGLYSIVNFLKLLYENADNNSFWKGYSNNKYIDATCFVNENYYSDKTWDTFVNDVQMRSFYVANEVEESKDGRSIYAKAAYGLQQYNIQTFYNRSLAGSITAFGCETTNDEEGKGYTVNGSGSQYQTNGKDSWDGRANMLTDIFSTNYYGTTNTWSKLKNNTSLVKACMSRNRDLNGDGYISQDEVRWYAPTIEQYAGLWIGEEVVSTDSKLFNRSTSTLSTGNDPGCRMLYYATTNGTNTFFAEEGMATNHYNPSSSNGFPPTYVRCIRNLKSNDIGYAETPDKYYTYTASDKKVSLENVDVRAVNATGEQGELNAHTERSEDNKPASAFYIASKTHGTATQANVVNGVFKCYGNYNETDKKWRVPNQREMSLMVLIDPSLVKNTFCRTLFSNTNFRKSWTYTDVFTMVNSWTTSGSVRCIKVIQ